MPAKTHVPTYNMGGRCQPIPAACWLCGWLRTLMHLRRCLRNPLQICYVELAVWKALCVTHHCPLLFSSTESTRTASSVCNIQWWNWLDGQRWHRLGSHFYSAVDDLSGISRVMVDSATNETLKWAEEAARPEGGLQQQPSTSTYFFGNSIQLPPVSK